MNRRGFITGLTGLLCAPALVRASSLDALPRGVVLGAFPKTITTDSPSKVLYWLIVEASINGRVVAFGEQNLGHSITIDPPKPLDASKEYKITLQQNGELFVSRFSAKATK